MIKCIFGVLAFGLLVNACGSSGYDAPPPPPPPAKTTERPLALAEVNDDKVLGDELARCINEKDANCQFPYIDVSDANKISNILRKTYVSDSWQATRFKTYLEMANPVVLEMFGCTKAVMIAGDIRPSHYYAGTAAIYLDAGTFAGNAEETATVDPAKDYRSEYNAALPYTDFSYLTIQGKMFARKALDEKTRILARLDYLLIHELAHACDFKIEARTRSRPSSTLPNPPKGAALDYAKWRYAGDADSKKRLDTYTAEDVGKAIDGSVFSDLYGFNNKVEHFAMLVQERLFYEIDRRITTNGFVDISAKDVTEEKLRNSKILWVQSGKICEPETFKLSAEAVKAILPDFPLSENADECMKASPAVGGTLQDYVTFDPPAVN